LIIDGTGQAGRKGDVGISGEKIIFAGEPFSGCWEGKIICAEGKVVAPGFIDIHSHSDFNLLLNPKAESKVCQGVTTELVGQCGVSGAPLEGAVKKRKKDELVDSGLSINWSTLNEYLLRLEEVEPIVNVATLVGHGNLRGAVAGYENRPATKKELQKMKTLLAKSLEMGAFGLSTGLIYPPGIYSSAEELLALTKLVAEFGGIYATHLRSEGDELIESVQEALFIAEETGVSLQLSHLKTQGKRNWTKLPSLFRMIEDSRRKGINVHADRYPYTASSTDLDILLPSWAWEGGGEKELKHLEEPDSQDKMTKEILFHNPEPEFWDNVIIATVKNEKNRYLEGKTLTEIAAQKKRDPWDVLYKLLREEELNVSANFFFMSEENLKQILSKEYCMIGTDSAARSVSGILSRGKPHPRGFGTYPRILHRWTGPGKLFSMETAIHKMTGLPAKKIGLDNRGIIRTGYFADLVVFNPSAVKDQADYGNPFQCPVGIEHVFVNGEEIVTDGKITGKKPGKILRKRTN
ncbi:MAG: D-aminoacylase, partial [Proteobacteria bacterium]|nr:D-aminoacylase [Pseudomonadota bacterium]